MKNTNLDLKSVKNQAQKLLKLEARHAAFLVVMVILAVYLITVWKIGQLATAEPSIDQQADAEKTGRLLRVDEAAIKQIQELEHRNVNIQSLFNEARKNPFLE